MKKEERRKEHNHTSSNFVCYQLSSEFANICFHYGSNRSV